MEIIFDDVWEDMFVRVEERMKTLISLVEST